MLVGCSKKHKNTCTHPCTRTFFFFFYTSRGCLTLVLEGCRLVCPLTVSTTGCSLPLFFQKCFIQMFRGKPLCWRDISRACCSVPWHTAKHAQEAAVGEVETRPWRIFPALLFCLGEVLLSADKKTRLKQLPR